MDQDKNIEEILLEVGFSSGSAPKPDEPDVDRLLKEILAEQTEYKPAPPQPEGKKQNASTGSPVRAGTEKHTTEEPPTKVFKTGTFRKKRPAPAQPAPAKEPPFFRKAETIRETISGKTPRSFQADEKKPAQTEAAKPLDGKKETFSIDIDAIRAGQPAPKMIPAQKLEDSSEGERLRPVDLLRKKPPRPPEDQPEKESYAPCFQRLGQRAASEEPGQQEVILRKEARISLIMGLSVGLLTVMILVITMFTGLRREADAAFVPGRATLAVVTLLGAAAGGLSWEMVGGRHLVAAPIPTGSEHHACNRIPGMSFAVNRAVDFSKRSGKSCNSDLHGSRNSPAVRRMVGQIHGLQNSCRQCKICVIRL